MDDRFKNYYDIVLLPPPVIRDQAIAASRAIRDRFGSDLVLGRRSFKPHVSLYHVAIRKENITEAIRRLRRIARAQGPKEPLSVSVALFNRQPQLQISCPQWLQMLHEQVVQEINPLRDRTYASVFWRHAIYQTAAYHKNTKQYGSPIVLDMYNPHITLTSLHDDRNGEQAIKFIRMTHKRFTPTALSVCQIGPHGSCHRIIATIPFVV